MEEAAGEVGAALEAARERLHPVPGPVSNPERSEQLIDPVAEPGAGEAVEGAVEAEVLRDGQPLVEGGLLEDDAEPLPDVRRLRGHVQAEDARRALARAEQRREDAEEGGLPAAVGAEEAEERARRHAQRHTPERDVVAVAVRDVRDVDGLLGHGCGLNVKRLEG